MNRREDFLRYPESMKQFLTPAAVFYRESQRSGSVRHLRTDFSGKTEADIILRREDKAYLVEQNGAFFFHPVQSTDHHSCPGLVEKFFFHKGSGNLPHLFKERTGTLIQMDNGGADRLFIPVQRHHSVHLAGEAHRIYFGCRDSCRRSRPCKSSFHSCPPRLRILLGPGNHRDPDFIGGIPDPESIPYPVHDQNLRA